MFAVFNPKGYIVHYTLSRTAKGAIFNFSNELPRKWDAYQDIGYFVHKVSAFIIPISTVKVFTEKH